MDPEEPHISSSELPCCRTERFAKPSSVIYQRRDGWVVLDTPACRESSFGHRLELDRPVAPGDWEDWFLRWAEHHAGKGVQRAYLTFEVESPWSPGELSSETSFDPLTCLVIQEDLPSRAMPPGYRLDLFRGDQDWAALKELSALVEGAMDDDFRRYADWYLGGLRERIDQDEGLWMGVSFEDDLVGAAGLFWRGQEARFQNVQTHPDHRGRGVASGLLSWVLAKWAKRSAGGGGRAYIAATTGGHIERLYRNLGFEPCSWFYTLGRDSHRLTG